MSRHAKRFTLSTQIRDYWRRDDRLTGRHRQAKSTLETLHDTFGPIQAAAIATRSERDWFDNNLEVKP